MALLYMKDEKNALATAAFASSKNETTFLTIVIPISKL